LGSRSWFAERQPGVLQASAIVLVLADRLAYTDRYAEPDKAGHGLHVDRGWLVPYWLTDAAMAAQNLLLVAESEGVGALFAGVFRDPRPALADWGVPSSVDCIGMVLIGHRSPDDRPSGTPTKRARLPRRTVVHVGEW
jgi:nitroreductase